MNAAHLHLILNHSPVFLCLVGLGILAYGMIREEEEIKRIALVLFLLTGLTAIPVYYSGTYAEEIVEELSGVQEEPIEHHESTAETSYYLALILGVVALLGIGVDWRGVGLNRWYWVIMVALAVVVFVSFLRTAQSGGEIRHPEINIDTGVSHQQDDGPPPDH